MAYWRITCSRSMFDVSLVFFKDRAWVVSEIPYWDRSATQPNANILHNFSDWTAEVDIRLSVEGLATALILFFFVDREIMLLVKQDEGVTWKNTKSPVFDRHFLFLALTFLLLVGGISIKKKSNCMLEEYLIICFSFDNFVYLFYFHINIVLFILTIHSIGWILT